MYQRAPIFFLLQCIVALKFASDLQIPFHLDGIGPIPLSLKDSDSPDITV